MKFTHRIFLSLSIALSSISTIASISNDQLKIWQTTYLNAMTPEELQLTANFLYISYAIALVESKIKQFNIPISRLNQSVRLSIANYQNVNDDLVTLKTLLDRLSFVVGARTIYMETYNVCQKYYNDHATSTMQAALEDIQNNAQIQLRAWADERTNTTADQLKKASDEIGQSAQYIMGISGTYNGMSKGDLPIDVALENEKNKSLIMLNLILNSTPQFVTVAENVAHTLNETSDNVTQLVTAGAEIYKQYYAIIHYLLMSPTFDQQYATTMFGMHDMLPEEYKTLLPDAKNVFSHMLETTKLYTQSELVQQ
jgi:regulator of replication initiation timing